MLIAFSSFLFIFAPLGLSDSEDEEQEDEKPKGRGDVEDGAENPLITDLDNRDKKTKKIHKAQLWFEKDVFKNLENEDDADFELDKMVEAFKNKGGKIIGDEQANDVKPSVEVKNEDDSDSDYDMEIMAKDKKVKKVGGVDGFEVVAKNAREYILRYRFRAIFLYFRNRLEFF